MRLPESSPHYNAAVTIPRLCFERRLEPPVRVALNAPYAVRNGGKEGTSADRRLGLNPDISLARLEFSGRNGVQHTRANTLPLLARQTRRYTGSRPIGRRRTWPRRRWI